MSQPCLSKPKGCPLAAGPLWRSRTQYAGSWPVNSPGKSEMRMVAAMMMAANQKMGRLRRRFHASPHIEEGAPSSGTASTAPRPVSSMSET